MYTYIYIHIHTHTYVSSRGTVDQPTLNRHRRARFWTHTATHKKVSESQGTNSTTPTPVVSIKRAMFDGRLCCYSCYSIEGALFDGCLCCSGSQCVTVFKELQYSTSSLWWPSVLQCLIVCYSIEWALLDGYVCCSMLHCVAVLEELFLMAVYVAACYIVLQCAAGCCSVLIAACCRVLQGVAGCCRVLHVQCVDWRLWGVAKGSVGWRRTVQDGIES